MICGDNSMALTQYDSAKEGHRIFLLDEREAYYSKTSAGTVSPFALLPQGHVSAEAQPFIKLMSTDTSSGVIIAMDLGRTQAHDNEFALAYDPFSANPHNQRFKDIPVVEVKVRLSFNGLLLDSENEKAVRHRVPEIPHRAISLRKALAVQRTKNRVAISLLQNWLADESGYDEAVWPRVKRAIEEHRLSERPRFND
jgi:hypothetical protein